MTPERVRVLKDIFSGWLIVSGVTMIVRSASAVSWQMDVLLWTVGLVALMLGLDLRFVRKDDVDDT